MTTHATPSRSRSIDLNFDMLADLFLGDVRPEHDGGAESSARASFRVEGLVLGHLPVLGSIWVGQYASHLAERLNQPVALLRVREGQASLDVFGCVDAPAHDRSSSLPDAIDDAARHAPHWLIRVDEAAEEDLILTDGVDTVTLLTGADEAALVATYQTIRELAACAPDGASIGLAVMGAGAEEAASATDRLRRTAEAHLDRSIHIEAAIPRIAPRRATPFFLGACDAPLADVLARLTQARSQSPAPAEASRPVLRLEGHCDGGPETAVETVRPAEPQRELRRDPPDDVVLLTDHVAGLIRLASRCPLRADVELAADSEGRLHVLAGGPDAEPAAAAADAFAVAAWGEAHLPLLRRAEPALCGHHDSIAAHVLVGDPVAARPLLDTDLRIHLLSRVDADGRTVLCHHRLN